ncbi:MAG TPA: mandelate racemase/muconate lactonizing enzyme family protein [Acetobacteraceae bacterium]|nr:mandelate racemase/muconate lactonizing enzyme family protein [Acetobacteraceae bacterium]
MKIIAVETCLTRIPFDMGARPVSFIGTHWDALNTLWVRIVTDQGLEGWGEGFGHACVATTKSVVDTQLAPAVLGQDARDIAGLRARLSKAFHLYGRNGPHVYALSALDIALWDIAGKAAGLPLCRLLGAAPRRLAAYASLLRYGAPDLVAAACERALARGYRDIKLHEIEVPMVAAARAAIGPETRLMVDTNCPWTVAQAVEMAKRLRVHDLTWLEEPVWPPEDDAGLARVRAEGGVPTAAGENAGGLHDFRRKFEAGAIDVAQPSVIKIGGPSAMLEIAVLAKAFGVRLVPHNAYFGPGYLASLHVNAAVALDAPFERIFIDLEASPLHDAITSQDGHVLVPETPGLGLDPDPAVLRRYMVGSPTITKN